MKNTAQAVEDLRKEIESKSHELFSLKKDYDGNQDKIKDHRHEIARRQAAVDSIDQEIKALESASYLIKDKITTLEKELWAHEGEIKKMQDDLEKSLKSATSNH